MGHKVGQLTLHAGIAGGADVILIPEIPYDIDKVCEAIKKRKGFTILAVAEGAIPKERAEMSKKELKKFMETYPYPTVSYEIADQLTKRLGSEVRVTVPGHTQRGGSPCPYDRVLSTRLGAAAAQAIVEDDYGYMIGIVNGETKRVPLEKSAGKLKFIDPESSIIKEAKMVGICFGD
jgi:6-phosphofructokinase 1